MAITTRDKLIKLKMLGFGEFPQLLSNFCPTDFPVFHFRIRLPKNIDSLSLFSETTGKFN